LDVCNLFIYHLVLPTLPLLFIFLATGRPSPYFCCESLLATWVTALQYYTTLSRSNILSFTFAFFCVLYILSNDVLFVTDNNTQEENVTPTYLAINICINIEEGRLFTVYSIILIGIE
jgi:hypothetical protein